MAWKIDGKIAAHFPNAGAVVNRDTYQIQYVPTGGTQSSLQEIEKVFFIPPGVTITTSNLNDYLVWRRYWEVQRTLVEGTQTVCIELVPTDDINLSSLAIFTDDSESSTTVNCGILHESGIVVYKSNVDNIDHNTTKNMI